MIRSGVLLVFAAALSACATNSIQSSVKYEGEELGLGPRPSGLLLIRESLDADKINGKDVEKWVRYYWDYDRGIPVKESETVLDQAKTREDQPGLTLNTTPAEIERAFGLVRGHSDLQKLVDRPDARFYGGFSLLEAQDPICHAGSRCVHVMVSGGIDGQSAIAHAIVDLMSDRVVYPFYVAPKDTQPSS